MLYYEGLKNHIKDKFARTKLPTTYQEMVRTAIQIDSRMYDRFRETGRFPRNAANTAQPRNSLPLGDPMDLDANQRRTPRLAPEEEQRRREKGLCFHCGKHGHISRNCPDKQTSNRRTNDKRTTSATKGQPETPDHDTLHWSTCSIEACPTHQEAKNISGYYPKN